MTPSASEHNPELPFDIPTYEDWKEIAIQELNGVDPAKKLNVRKGDIEIFPFYSVPITDSRNTISLNPSDKSYFGARNWKNIPKILITDETKANEIALSHLNSGAEGILFDCPSKDINPVVLLNNISLSDCAISFLINETDSIWLSNFRDYAESHFDKSKINGGIYWGTGKCDMSAISAFSDWHQFHSLGLIINPLQDASDEIAVSLKKAVDLINDFTEKEFDATAILDQISFSVTVGTDFFLEIAKIKSLRNLWFQIKCAYNSSSVKTLHIHTLSKTWIKEAFQPHGNMIKSTTSAMAAILGGCDSLTIEEEDENNETMRRIATHVSSILREESHFSKVADPTVGSYYIDSLTMQLSEKAWNKFQSHMK